MSLYNNSMNLTDATAQLSNADIPLLVFATEMENFLLHVCHYISNVSCHGADGSVVAVVLLLHATRELVCKV